MAGELRNRSSFWAWYRDGLIGLAAMGFAINYGALHLIAKVPFRSVLAPWLAISLLGATVLPVFYWSAEYAGRSGGDKRPIFLLAGITSMLSCPIIFYYACNMRLISVPLARGSCIAGLIAVPPCTILAYYIEKKLGT